MSLTGNKAFEEQRTTILKGGYKKYILPSDFMWNKECKTRIWTKGLEYGTSLW